MTMTWIMMNGVDVEALGFLPTFFSEDDPRPAAQQLDENYQHGGGWLPMPEFTFDAEKMELNFPGDPPFQPIAFTTLHDEMIILFEHEIVCILQPGGAFEAGKVD